MEEKKTSLIDAYHKCLDTNSWRKLAKIDGFFMTKKTKKENLDAFQEHHELYSLLAYDDTSPEQFKKRLIQRLLPEEGKKRIALQSIENASDEELFEIISNCKMTPQQTAKLAGIERFKNLLATGDYFVDTIGHLTLAQVKDIYGQDEAVLQKVVDKVSTLEGYRALAGLTTIGNVVFEGCKKNANLCLGLISSAWSIRDNFDDFKDILKNHINNDELDDFKLVYGAAELLSCLLKISEYSSEDDDINIEDNITPEMIIGLVRQKDYHEDFPFQVVKLLAKGKCLDVLKPNFLPRFFVFDMQKHMVRKDSQNYNLQGLYKQESARILFLGGLGLQKDHYVGLVNNGDKWVCDQIFRDINLCGEDNASLQAMLTEALDEITNPDFFVSLCTVPNTYLIEQVFADGWDKTKMLQMYINTSELRDAMEKIEFFKSFRDFVDLKTPKVPQDEKINLDDTSHTPPNLPERTPIKQVTPNTLMKSVHHNTVNRRLFKLDTPSSEDTERTDDWELEAGPESPFQPQTRNKKKKPKKKGEPDDNNNNASEKENSDETDAVPVLVKPRNVKLGDCVSPNAKLARASVRENTFFKTLPEEDLNDFASKTTAEFSVKDRIELLEEQFKALKNGK